MTAVAAPDIAEQSGSDIAQLKGFDAYMGKLMRDWKVNGVAVAIAYDGEIVLCRGYGLRDVERGLEVNAHTLMPIGSTTKTFVTAGIAQLADGGLVDWDTPVRRYLPTLQLWDPVATERLTPRDMACHRSGLPRHDLMWYGSDRSRRELFDSLQYLEPSADFRTKWQYQNLMYMTLGYLTEQISGLSWEDYVQQRIFDPLGMVSSRPTASAAKESPDLSRGYRKSKNKVEEIPLYEGFKAVAPAGSIVSSVYDMSQWLLVHLNGGKHHGEQFISEAQIRQMHAPNMVMESEKWAEMPHSSYGLAWFVQPYRGHNMIHHGGNIDGFSTMFALMPERRVGVVVLTNMDATPVRDIVQYNVFDRFIDGKQVAWSARMKAQWKEMEEAGTRGKEKSKSDQVKRTHPSHPLQDYVGTYGHPGYAPVKIELQDGKLQALYNGITLEMKHYHYDTFSMAVKRFDLNLLASFITDVRGTVQQLSIPLEPTVQNIVFTRLPDESLTSRSFLEQFVGTYELMGALISIEFKGDVLQIAVPGMPDYELQPVKGTEFALKGLSGFSIEFKRDGSGAVTEALVNQMGSVYTAKKR
jgi:CubicO group peptidase (beta-lactamase class C family)